MFNQNLVIMKKAFPILAIVAFVISMASCTKEYICDCTDTDSSGTQVATSTSTIKGKKKDAETFCTGLESNPNIFGGQTTCVLK